MTVADGDFPLGPEPRRRYGRLAAALLTRDETLERREQASRAFAREAITLAIRLRRGIPGREGQLRAELADLERALKELR